VKSIVPALFAVEPPHPRKAPQSGKRGSFMRKASATPMHARSPQKQDVKSHTYRDTEIATGATWHTGEASYEHSGVGPPARTATDCAASFVELDYLDHDVASDARK
jgi:hypothetical protein